MLSINPWKCFVVGGLGTCIVVNVSFLALSLRKPSIPVDSHPYESGLKYQENIDSEGEMLRRGWVLTVRTSPSSELPAGSIVKRVVAFSIKDGNGEDVILNSVGLRAVNPVNPEADTSISFTKNTSGEWSGPTTLTPGQWLFTWTFMVNQEKFSFKEKRMI